MQVAARPVPVHALVPFLAVAFSLAWGILGLYLFLPEPMVRTFGELTGQHPLFYLAVYAPAIAALMVVIRHGGAGGLRRFLSRLLLWRCPAGWYAFLLIGIPAVFFASAALMGRSLAEHLHFSSLEALIGALALMAIKGPVEELGWRGVALPLLQRRLAPLWAGLALGLVWGLWHLPAFLLGGTPQGAWSFGPFLAGSVAASVIATALFNASRGSILLAALLHFQLINPLWPDAQPYDMFGFVLVAVLTVWLNRRAMLRKGEAVVEVIPKRVPAPPMAGRESAAN
jgi:membrane protease YdiL (CAAX protease family)